MRWNVCGMSLSKSKDALKMYVCDVPVLVSKYHCNMSQICINDELGDISQDIYGTSTSMFLGVIKLTELVTWNAVLFIVWFHDIIYVQRKSLYRYHIHWLFSVIVPIVAEIIELFVVVAYYCWFWQGGGWFLRCRRIFLSASLSLTCSLHRWRCQPQSSLLSSTLCHLASRRLHHTSLLLLSMWVVVVVPPWMSSCAVIGIIGVCMELFLLLKSNRRWSFGD